MKNIKKNNQTIIIGILIIIIVGIAAFYGGMKYQQSKAVAQMPSRGQFARNGQGFGGRGSGAGLARGGFGGIVMGDVVGSDATSITVKLADGSSKIVNLTNSTTYTKTDAVSKSDITNGIKVAVIGATNSDGSVTATSVELNPPARMTAAKGGTTPMVSK